MKYEEWKNHLKNRKENKVEQRNEHTYICQKKNQKREKIAGLLIILQLIWS